MNDGSDLVVKVRLTAEDYYVFRTSLLREMRASWRYRILRWLLFFLFAGAIAATAQFFVTVSRVPAWLAVLACAYPAALVYDAIAKLVAWPLERTQFDPRGMSLTDRTIRANLEGIYVTGGWGEAHYLWTAVLRVKETASHIFVLTDVMTGVVVPKSGFASRADAERFGDFVRARCMGG